MQLLELIAILMTGLLLGIEMAIGLIVEPTMSEANDETRSDAYYSLARTYRRVVPWWYAAVLLLYSVVALKLHRSAVNGYRQAEAAAILMLVAIACTVPGAGPTKNRSSLCRLARLPRLTAQVWPRFFQHFFRVVVLAAALFLFVAACFESA